MAYDSARHPKSKTGAEFSLVVIERLKDTGNVVQGDSAAVVRNGYPLLFARSAT